MKVFISYFSSFMIWSSIDIVRQRINEKISLSRGTFIPNIAGLCSNVHGEVTHFKNWKILSWISIFLSMIIL